MWLGEQREPTRQQGNYPRPYGGMSLLELGWLMGRLGTPDGAAHVSLGVSPLFPSSEYLQSAIIARAKSARIAHSLPETVRRALTLLH